MFMKLITTFLLFVSVASAQAPVANNKYTWASIKSAGYVGQYIDLAYQSTYPTNFSVSWTVTGTAPSGCTFNVLGSNDGVSWYGLDSTPPATDPNPCTSSNMVSVVSRPTQYLWINVVSYTGGDTTTKVVFTYVRGTK